MSNKKIKEIYIEDIEFPNKGIGHIDGKKVIVKRTIPKQKVKILLGKRRRKLQGRLIEVIEKAEEEINPLCPEDKCGGCTFKNIPYEYELILKKKMVEDLFKNADIKIPEMEIFGNESPYYYRNKMEYSFGDEEIDGKVQLGMRNIGSRYEVSNGENCNIAPKDFGLIVGVIKEYIRKENIPFYHKMKREGILRHLVVREGYFTKEILVNLITTSTDIDFSPLVAMLLDLKLDSKIVGILHAQNDSIADIVQADKLDILYGQDFFHEEINGLKFKISPFSFFQTNSWGAEKLYETIKEYAKDTKGIIYDLYCGTGTIAQILSPIAKEVIGIEIVEEAVDKANENLKLNNIKNTSFICGDVLKEISNLNKSPELIVLDPPREGINPKAIKPIMDFKADKIIYISCKATSLIEDLDTLLEEYEIEKIKLHDMFPRSGHVETVVVLNRE